MAARYFSFTLTLLLVSSIAECSFAQRSGTRSTTDSPDSSLNQPSSASSLSGGQQSSLGGRSTTTGQQSSVRPRTGPQSRQLQEQGFVGRSAEDVQETFRNLNGRQRRRATFNMIVENLNEMRESRKRRREQRTSPPKVRVNLRPTFDFPRRSDVEVAAGVQTRLDKVMRERGVTMPQVELAERTATLRGTVRTEHDKALVEKLVSIEPGVSQVENRLVVAE